MEGIYIQRGREDMIYIGFTGAHCTGKTTTAYLLKRSMKTPRRWLVVHDIVAGLPPDDNKYRLQCNIMDVFILLEGINRRKRLRGVIQDRTIYDVYAYSRLVLDDTKFSSFYRRYRDAFREPRYDYVFFFPIRFKCPEQRAGHWGEQYRKEIEEYVLEALDRFKVDYITVRGRSPEARVKNIRKVIKEVK